MLIGLSKLSPRSSNFSRNWIERPKAKNWLVNPAETLSNIIFGQKNVEVNALKKLNIKIEKYKMTILENWDIEECIAFSEVNWKRTTDIIKAVFENLKYSHLNIPFPTILPHTDSSFDIHWSNKDFHLTVTVLSDLNQPIDIYGQKISSPEFELEVLIHYDLVEKVLDSWLKKIL